MREGLNILNTVHGCDVENEKVQTVPKTFPLCPLNSFVDECGVLCAGGRVQKGDFAFFINHPIILPRKCHIIQLIIRYFHQHTRYQGRNITTNKIRSNGYWIIGCTSALYSFISTCVKYPNHRSQTQNQSDLPDERFSTNTSFTHSGIDFIGPSYIKGERRELKRYGVLFTCMSSRAVHLETASSLDRSSFISTL